MVSVTTEKNMYKFVSLSVGGVYLFIARRERCQLYLVLAGLYFLLGG